MARPAGTTEASMPSTQASGIRTPISTRIRSLPPCDRLTATKRPFLAQGGNVRNDLNQTAFSRELRVDLLEEKTMTSVSRRLFALKAAFGTRGSIKKNGGA